MKTYQIVYVKIGGLGTKSKSVNASNGQDALADFRNSSDECKYSMVLGLLRIK